MHPKKRRRVSPESRRDGEKDQGPVIKVVWVNEGLSRALRLSKVRILVYAVLRREWKRCYQPGAVVLLQRQRDPSKHSIPTGPVPGSPYSTHISRLI